MGPRPIDRFRGCGFRPPSGVKIFDPGKITSTETGEVTYIAGL